MNEQLTKLYNSATLDLTLKKLVSGHQIRFEELKQEIFLILLEKTEDYIKQRVEYLEASAVTIAKTLLISKRQNYRKHNDSKSCQLIDVPESIDNVTAFDVFPAALERLNTFEQHAINSVLRHDSIKKASEKTGFSYAYLQKTVKRAKIKLQSLVTEEIEKVDCSTVNVYRKREGEGISVLDEIERI